MNPQDTNDIDEPSGNSGQSGQSDQPTQTGQSSSAPAPPVSTPDNAEDVDLIEKAWVEKAKEIVDGTHNDPFTQSKQLNQMKADYIKKRYNRDIKVDE